MGLTGKELDLKIYLYNTALKELELEEGRFRKIKKDFREIPKKAKNAGRWLHDRWQQLFEYANVILGSLSSVGVVGADAIAEVKTVIEKIIIWRRNRKSKNQ